jgi:hypothetical protein
MGCVMSEVMNALKIVGDVYRSEGGSAALKMLSKLWTDLPVPANSDPNAFWVVEHAVEISLREGDADGAWKWALLSPQFSSVRHDAGESEMLLGKAAYARGDFGAAKDYFIVADRKSESRIFMGEDRKYRDCLKEMAPKKY